MTKKKKKLIALGVILAFLICHDADYIYEPIYEIHETTDLSFGSYSRGRVFIGDSSYLANLTDLSKNDVLVLDQRFGTNPNINSCNIVDKDEINEILEILCRYEECNPSPWDRTIESMRLEWFMHNYSYYFNYQTHRTKDVDLDNNDEIKYNSDIVRKILRL